MQEGELGKTYSDGEVIFHEGDTAEVMYVIQSGKVRIAKKAASGNVTIATLQSGDIFGEMALFDRLPRSATVISEGDARVLSIDKKKLFATISRDPTLVFKILESMSQRIRRLNEELTKFKKSRLDVLTASMDVDGACNLILDEAKNLVHADNGSIMLFDENDKTLSIRAAFGVESGEKVKFCAGEGIAGDVIKTGNAELANNVMLDSRFKKGEMHIQSLLCVPLRYDVHDLGVMNMSITSDRLFTLDDLKLLNSLSVYAAMAIHNARNLSTLKSAAERVLMHATLLDV